MQARHNGTSQGDPGEPASRRLGRTRVLVLNQNYQPLNVCGIRRAFSLLGRGNAETLEETGRYLRSAYAAFAVPSVIRLIYLVKRPVHARRLSRREVFMRDRFQCQYCGVKTRSLTLDHVVPRSRGGTHDWSNVVSACGVCNHRKAGRTPREAHMRLSKVPAAPRPNPYAFFHVGAVQEDWRPFMPWIDDGRVSGNGMSEATAGG